MFDESKSGSLTNTAYNYAIQSSDKYACQTAEDCLQFLTDDSHFSSLALKLSEIVKEKLQCDDNHKNGLLYRKIAALDINNAPARNTVRNWMNGNTASIDDIENIIKICFALGFDYDESCEFFTKTCGMPQLNVRSAKEAIYMYCLMNKRDYIACKNLENAYNNVLAKHTYDDNDIIKEETTGDTTRSFVEQLSISQNWKDDEDFLQNFLIPNKDRFIGYSRTTIATYYKLKKELLIKVIDRVVEEESNRTIYENAYDRVSNNIIPLTMDEDFKRMFGSDLAIDISSPKAAWECIKKAIDSATQIDDKDKSIVLHEIVSMDRMCKELLVDFPYDYTKDDFKNIRESSLHNEFNHVLDSFPRATYFEAFENGDNQSPTKTRKIIVFLLFMNYLYDYMKLDDEDQKFFFTNFYDKMDTILFNCRLAPIYLANRFDWLILRCIQEFEKKAWNEESDPEDFFGEIIALSFASESDS